tara:strand:+ start:65 stop:448 length:384 start_codon:yes stop_codon:yes gene_type:complete
LNPRQYKATISLNKAINRFLEQGYYVFSNVCDQGPIDIIVFNPKTKRAHFFDVKTSKGPSTIVNGKAVGGTGAKLKPKQKEIGVRLVLVEGEEIRIVETREEISKRQRKEKRFHNKARKGINFLEEC